MATTARATKIAALYVRVSDPYKQADNYSLETQEATCREYAATQGYAIREAHIYREVHTAAELYERPALTAAREAMQRGEFDAFVCFDPDRFSRSQVHTAILQDFCERASVELRFALFDFEQTPTGRFLLNARAFAAELEREKIIERTQRGMLARMRSGKLKPSGHALYGYRWRDGSRSALEIDETTAPIVRRIFRELAEGRSQRSVAEGLNAEGFQTPQGAQRWRHSTVRVIANNPAYTGVAVANRTTMAKVPGKRGSHQAKPASEHIPLPEGTIPPLITAEEFAAATAARGTRADISIPKTTRDPHSHLLRGGFIRCGNCGRKVHAANKSGQYRDSPPQPVYRTALRVGEHYDCPAMSISARKLDAAVLDDIKTRILDEDALAAEVARLRESDPTAADLASIERTLKDIERRRTNLTRKLALFDDDEAAVPLVTEISALAQQKRQLEVDREAVLTRRDDWRAVQDGLESLEAWRRLFGANLDEATYEQKRQFFTALGVRVTLYPHGHNPRYRIEASIPCMGGQTDSAG